MDQQSSPGNTFSDWVALNLGVYQGLIDLWLGYLRAVAGLAPSGLGYGAGSRTDKVVLEGKRGEIATGSYFIENPSFRRVKVRVAVPEALTDKHGNRVNTQIRVEPAELELGPWQKRYVQIRVPMGDELEEGREYTSTLEAHVQTQTAKIVVQRCRGDASR